VALRSRAGFKYSRNAWLTGVVMYVPKHAIRVSPKDILRCSVWSKGASYDLYVRYVLMLDDGTVVPGMQFINQGGGFN